MSLWLSRSRPTRNITRTLRRLCPRTPQDERNSSPTTRVHNADDTAVPRTPVPSSKRGLSFPPSFLPAPDKAAFYCLVASIAWWVRVHELEEISVLPLGAVCVLELSQEEEKGRERFWPAGSEKRVYERACERASEERLVPERAPDAEDDRGGAGEPPRGVF